MVLLRPDLGQIERVDRIAVGFLLRHDLHIERPPWEIAAFDGLEEIAHGTLAIAPDRRYRFGIRHVLDALLRAEVELYPEALILSVEEAVGMAAEAVHMAPGPRDAALPHTDRDLMKRFRQQRPKIPVVVGAAHSGARIALYGMVQIGELQRVFDEEDRRVVPDEIPVAFVGVEFQ